MADHNKAVAMNPRDAHVYINRGATYTAKRDYDHAVADFTKAIELNPQGPKVYHAYYNRGAIYEALGRRVEAIWDYQRALAINPNDQDSREALKRLGFLP